MTKTLLLAGICLLRLFLAWQPTKDFPGVTGKITLDANRNAQVPVYILRIEGGKFTLQN